MSSQTYEYLAAILNGQREVITHKSGSPTRVQRFADDAISVVLYTTPIITASEDGTVILLDCGGHHTKTTAARMNEYLRDGFSVRIHHGKLEARRNGETWSFYNDTCALPGFKYTTRG